MIENSLWVIPTIHIFHTPQAEICYSLSCDMDAMEGILTGSLSANLSLERALFWRDIEPPRFIPLLAFVPSLLQFAPKLAIERIRAAAAQRDGKAQQPPQQHIFVAASHPIEAVGPISDRDEQHLDGRSRSKEPREQ